MVGLLFMLALAGPPEPEPEPEPQAETLALPPAETEAEAGARDEQDAPEQPEPEPKADERPPEAPAPAIHQARWEPNFPTPRRIPVLRRCLARADPCYRTTSARLLLAGIGAATTAASLYTIFSAGDLNRAGDPAAALASGGVIAMSAAAIGGVAGLLRGDGPTLYDRITPPTFGLSLGVGGSDVSDETLPYSLAGTFAPTLSFPRDRGRLRLVGSFGGNLGNTLERDPRPQTANDDGSFATALEARSWNFTLGLDLAVRLPYPLVPRPAWLGQLELRYKPLVFFARDALTLGETERVNQRVAITPLNFGLRWHVSPRQRVTTYLGPRWDLIGHGEPGAVETGAPELAPIYAETWFDLDIPLRELARAHARSKPAVVGQLTLGYVHSRFAGNGINVGSIIGFLGHVVAQFAVRVRPLGSPVAYQVELGARVGQGLSPFVRFGVVLPDIRGGKS